MKSLDHLVEAMHEHARAILIGSATEQLVPFFHIQFKNRPDAIIPTPWSDDREKTRAVGAIRAAMAAFRPDIVNYAMISEAWTAKYDHAPRQGDLMPSQRETRKECVIVSAGDHDGATMKVWEIVRDDKGRVTDLVEEKHGPDHFEGRMFNLLADED